MKILQIIPRLPPAACGVGDYAHELAREWKRHGVATCFLGGDPAWRGVPGEFPADAVAARSSAALCESLDRLHARDAFDVMVLHFSGYGYAPRGAPLWLLRGLKSWLRSNPAVPLVTMFHELFATGPVTSSAFWLGALQKRVSAQLARISARIRTNRTASAQWLATRAPEHEGRTGTLSVFSSMGENPAAPAASERPKTLVLFSYQSSWGSGYWQALSQAIARLGIEQVIGLGQDHSLGEADRSGIRIEQKGFLPAEEISSVLQQARFGYLGYHTGYLGKSSILAAYAAHGVVPVIAPWSSPLSEGLVHGQQVLRAEALAEEAGEICDDRLSENIRQWYAPHSVAATAAAYLEDVRLALRA